MASMRDRKSTRLNSSHGYISYAVFCLKKKKKKETKHEHATCRATPTTRRRTAQHVCTHDLCLALFCLLSGYSLFFFLFFFFFNDTATTEIYTLSLHDALPISGDGHDAAHPAAARRPDRA